jgi:hypothetical protein
MEDLEQQLLALHAASLKDGGFSSAQSDTEDIIGDEMDEPLPLAKIDAREELQPSRVASQKHVLRQRLRAGKPMSGLSAEEDAAHARAFRIWVYSDDTDNNLSSSSSSATRRMLKNRGAREGDDTDDIDLGGGAVAGIDDVHIDGLFSFWKGLWSYTLYPISSEKVEHVPQAIRGGGDITLASADRQGNMSVHPEGKGTFTQTFNIKKVQGVAGAFVYEANFTVRRSDFFKLDNEPVFVTVSFNHPVTGKVKEMRLMADVASHGADMETLSGTRTWATVPDRAGDSLVLRFSRGSNPVLKQVFVLFRAPGSMDSSATAAAVDSGLSEKEQQLAAHILSGSLVPLEALHDTHTIANASAACIAVGTAACHATAAFAHISLRPLASPKDHSSSSTTTKSSMTLFKQYASVLANLGSVTQASGVKNSTMIAQERGELLGKYICSQLAGASKEKVTNVLQSLTNVSEVFYMRETHGTAQDVRERVDKFRVVKERVNAKQLYSQFYG